MEKYSYIKIERNLTVFWGQNSNSMWEQYHVTATLRDGGETFKVISSGPPPEACWEDVFTWEQVMNKLSQEDKATAENFRQNSIFFD